MTQRNDEEFDAELGRLIGAQPADTPALSRAVLTRLAAPEPGPLARGAEVLALPGPALGLFGGLMAGGMALGWLLLPAIGGESWVTLGLFGDLIGVTGGF